MVDKEVYDLLKSNSDATISGLCPQIGNMIQSEDHEKLKVGTGSTIAELKSTIMRMFCQDCVDKINEDAQAKFDGLKIEHDKCRPRIDELELAITGMVAKDVYDKFKDDSDISIAELQSKIKNMVTKEAHQQRQLEKDTTIAGLQTTIKGMFCQDCKHNLEEQIDNLTKERGACRSRLAELESKIEVMVLKEDADRQIEEVRREFE